MSEIGTQKPLHWYDAITINIYYFALTLRSQTLTPLIVPLLVQQLMASRIGPGPAHSWRWTRGSARRIRTGNRLRTPRPGWISGSRAI